jgi:carboxymethylenebutenolidase
MLAEVDYRRVQSSMVQCASGMDAYLALPGTPGLHPGVVLLHERYGLAQHTKDLATRFASEGYACIAPNLFFREPNQAEILRGDANGHHTDDSVSEDVAAAIERLALAPEANVERVAVMGVCATGRYPLVVAARRSDVEACLVFYGGTPRTDDGREPLLDIAKRSRAPVLGVFGELDHVDSVENVRAFRDCLEDARRSYHIKLVAGVPHGFLNDTMPGRYRRPEAEAAWQLLMDFLRRVRSRGFPSDRVQWTWESDISTGYDSSKNVRME